MLKCRYISQYIADIRSGKIKASKELKLAVELIERKLSPPANVFIDVEKSDKAVELIEKYFKIKLVPWECFVIELVHCYYPENDTVVFDEFFIMMGRGNGKNGFISGLAWYLTTHYHGVEEYNVDIIANSEKQAKTSFFDVYKMLTKTWDISQHFFRKTKEEIVNLKTDSYIMFNTSNAKTKDGARTGCLIVDEEHEYENDDTIGVFQSGFGKKKHCRIFKITTNGYVRDGVLDEDLRLADDVLNGIIKDIGLLPLIYKMDNDEECDNPDLWEKANPSINYFPELRKRIEKEFREKEYKKRVELDFFTKRMNLPRTNMAEHAIEWKYIDATNKPMIDLIGRPCLCGIDYASLRDWASVNLHFKVDGMKYDINHSWVCLRNPEIDRIKAPFKKWEHITLVDEEAISPDLLTEWIKQKMVKYDIVRVQIDDYRSYIMRQSLDKIGFDTKVKKNLKLIRPSDIARVIPVIESDFINGKISWGLHKPLRWAANNTSIITKGGNGETTGNRYYGKIEPKSRKTDPFMAYVASVVDDDLLLEDNGMNFIDDNEVYIF